MHLSGRMVPSFKFNNNSSRNSFSMPDYYRSTRREHFGPYYRSSQPARDLMKTVDLRVRESVDSVCALPDIEEEDEIDLDIKECEAVEQPENADGEAAHDGTGQRTESGGEQQCFVRLWHLFISALRKLCGGQPRNVPFDLV